MFENRKRQKELELKADIADIKLDHLPVEIREAFANDYVETIRKGKLIANCLNLSAASLT